jgi:hypothetical protein
MSKPGGPTPTGHGLNVVHRVGTFYHTTDAGIPSLAFNGVIRAILAGIDSAQSEATGWDALRDSIPDSAVVRTSDTVVTITLPALSTYDITALETLTVTIPGSALVSGLPIVATPTFTISQTSALSSGDGAALGDSIETAVGQAASQGTGASSGSSTVTAQAVATGLVTGLVTGSSTVVATGLASAVSVGATAGSATVAGIGQAADLSIGASAGLSQVTATGLALFTGVGVVAGDSLASGVSQDVGGASIGSADGSCAVDGVGSSTAVTTTPVGGGRLKPGHRWEWWSKTQIPIEPSVAVSHLKGHARVIGHAAALSVSVGVARGAAASQTVGVRDFNPYVQAQAEETFWMGLDEDLGLEIAA